MPAQKKNVMRTLTAGWVVCTLCIAVNWTNLSARCTKPIAPLLLYSSEISKTKQRLVRQFITVSKQLKRPNNMDLLTSWGKGSGRKSLCRTAQWLIRIANNRMMMIYVRILHGGKRKQWRRCDHTKARLQHFEMKRLNKSCGIIECQ